MLAAGASCDDELRLDCGAGSWQSKQSREEPDKEAAAVFDAKTAVRTND